MESIPYLSGLIHTWTASRSALGCFQKTEFCFKYCKFNFITNKLKSMKKIFRDLPPDLELDLLEQDPSCPTKFLTCDLKS